MMNKMPFQLRIRLVFALLGMFVAGVRQSDAEPIHLDLGGTWQLTQDSETASVPANVPGCVHTDLLAAGKIPDPFFRDNQKALQWIGESAWTYRRTFQVPPPLIAHGQVLLRCEGLDTVAAITINGRPVAQTDNMFRTYEFDVKSLLNAGDNSIEVRFSPTGPYIESFIKNARGPNSSTKGIANLRKAPYSNGWDFGPRFLTCGIYKKIELLAFDEARLTHVATRTEMAPAGAVTLNVDVLAERDADLRLQADAAMSFDGKPVATQVAGFDGDTGHLRLTVADPKLWWPNGMGAQPLYDLKVRLKDASGAIVDSRSIRVGLRTITLLPKSADRPLRLAVNGREMFAKGADWIPCDMFAPRVTTAQLRKYVTDAAAVHMNMLRCWGGGYYEEDAFYDACDEMGILVWSEFKFACAVYPAGNPAFADNVRAEVTDQVNRLRNHPCVAVWCGNNEVMSLITGYKILSQKDYDHLFHAVIGAQVSALMPEANYVGGSPEAGDEHNWWVWHVGADFEKYRESHGWMTEFGFQSYPCPATVDSYTDPADRTSVLSPVMKSHEHNGNGKGSEMIVDMMGRYFRPAKDFDSTLWLSQINQAYGVTMGIEHWRSDWPRSSGSLVWQYDDCWPGPSWSSVDYFGRWKALQYKLREAYAPLMVTALFDSASGKVRTTVCSDVATPSACRIDWRLTNIDGKTLDIGGGDLALPGGTCSVTGPELDLADRLSGMGPKNALLWITLKSAGEIVSEKVVWFVRPKEIELADPELSTTVVAAGDGFDVAIMAAHPALWIWLDLAGDPDAKYSNNFVHLAGDRPVLVHLTPSKKMPLADVIANLHARSLFDTYQGTR
jgi:beta-mannosidase